MGQELNVLCPFFVFMKKIFKILFLVVLIVSVGFNTWFMIKSPYEVKEAVRIERTDTIRDTIIETIPQVKNIVQIKTIRDTLKTTDTIDVEVEIPIVQKIYQGSNYNAYVSGYKPYLDSVQIFNTTVEKTVTETKYPRWVVGPTFTFGYDIYNRNLGLIIGIGITYNMLK